MSFLETWKEATAKRLHRIGEQLERLKQRDVPDFVYAAISASALYPLTQALQGGQSLEVALTFGAVAGAVGGNLLANQVQDWVNRADKVTEAEIGGWLSQNLDNVELRQALDNILEKLEVIDQAQKSLGDEDRQWFTQTLRHELQRMGNLSRFQAVLNVTVYVGAPSKDPREAMVAYDRMIVKACGQLPMRGVDVGSSDPTCAQKPLSLANVYVDLDTRTQAQIAGEAARRRRDESQPGMDRETRMVTALEATIGHRRLVLLGDPGGGKSTFVSHLAYCLAARALNPEGDWLSRLRSWPETENETVPVLVLLRDFARGLPKRLPRQADPKHLWDFIAGRLAAQKLESAAEAIGQALEKGRALVLLDGLDEVPTAAQRAFVRDAVLAFVKRYSDSRYLVTCRVLSYQPPTQEDNPDLRLPADGPFAFPSFELAPFNEEKIDRFIEAWYRELADIGVVRDQDLEGLAAQLRTAVRRTDLWRLAPNPLLLTVMALVHTHKGRLPDARALLYEDTVDILLWRWEQIKAGGQQDAPPLRQLLLEAGRSEVDLKRVLWRLAYEAHSQTPAAVGEDTLADIGEFKLEKALAQLKSGDRGWAQQVLEAMKLRAGLLLERAPEVFTFPHRTFQEYLAGAYLSSQGDFARRASSLAEGGALWREVILLAVGRLVYLAGDMDKPLALVGELCPSQAPAADVGWRKVWLAGDALLEIGSRVADSALGRDLQARVSERLVDLLEKGRLAPRERAAAGKTLARLGDPRKSVTTLDAMEFCYVPAGPFWMGEGKEKHLNKCLTYDYWIARYPVTVAQFKEFMEASGCQPDDPRSRAGAANHPVVRVSWYEAQAFCEWLTRDWREKKLLAEDRSVRLPSEAEWEKAARGGVEVPSEAVLTRLPLSKPQVELVANSEPECVYPWRGGKADPNRANYDQTGIRATSAVGCFPAGASPYGCEDLGGNVWEWTRSLRGKTWQEAFRYPYDPKDGREDVTAGDEAPRVLRGGAFYDFVEYVRSAVRVGGNPDFRSVDVGVRVVVSRF